MHRDYPGERPNTVYSSGAHTSQRDPESLAQCLFDTDALLLLENPQRQEKEPNRFKPAAVCSVHMS